MKTGTSDVAAYYVYCPYCREPLPDPRTGSFLIGRDSVDVLLGRSRRNTVECYGCGRPFKLPAAVVKLSR